jgi:YHS domain-containing protein/outer membrane murein-binding lipoprotein Lpp
MNLRKIILLTAVVVIGLGLTGCKKKEQPAPKAPAMENVQKQAEEMKRTADQTAEEAKKAVETAAAEVEQTTCPILEGNKINKNVFVEYKGKKVYFCCADCKAVFEKDPEKYIAKLPQFAK